MTRSRWKWSEFDLIRLEEMIQAGKSDEQIGRMLGCTVNAVRIARKRHHIPSRQQCLYSNRKVARLLGLSCSKTVAWWISRGWLVARRGQRAGPYRMWYTTEDALLDFLANPSYWHLWSPVKVADADLRSWLVDIRNGMRFLTVGEVARRVGVDPHTANQWIRKGYLPAVRRGNWLVREVDLDGFILPCDRPRAGRRLWRFSEQKDEMLYLVRDSPSFAAASRQCGRTA